MNKYRYNTSSGKNTCYEFFLKKHAGTLEGDLGRGLALLTLADLSDRERFELNDAGEESCRRIGKEYSVQEKKQIRNLSLRVV